MPVIQDSPSPLKVYTNHGVHLHDNGSGQSIGECPFCNREDKFYVGNSNGLFDCKRCGRTGNPIEFLRLLYEQCLENTTPEQYQSLAAQRGYMTTDPVLHWGLAFNPLRDEWVLPGFRDDSDELKQLYRWTDYGSKDGKRHLWATPGFDQCLGGVHLWDKHKPDVWLLEGAWDGMCLFECFRLLKHKGNNEYEPTGSIESSLYGNANILSVPSSNSFTEFWARLLMGKRVFIVPHNDWPRIIKDSKTGKERVEEPAAWQGFQRIIRKLVEWDIRPKELHYIAWGGDHNSPSDTTSYRNHDPLLKHGYDVRDLITSNDDGTSFLQDVVGGDESQPPPKMTVTKRIQELERRGKRLSQLFNMVRPVPTSWYDPGHTHSGEPSSNGKGRYVGLSSLPCDKWVILEDAMKKAYTWHPGLRKTLAVMLAVVTCTMRPKDQLWMKIVAPPSSGKTEMGNSIGTNGEYVKLKSNFTGFFSGVRQSKKDAATNGKKDDLGLLKEIMGKTFIVKDADTLLKNPNRERILAEMRDFYDGNTQTYFKLGTGREYHNIRVSVILIGTSSLYTLDAADLGDRFLTCCMGQLPRELSQRISKSSLMKMFSTDAFGVTDKPESMEDNETLKAKQLAAGYVDYLRRNADTLINKVQRSAANESIVSEIEALAEFMGMMRSRPSSKQDEQVEHELSIRATKQLGKLAVCLAVVLNKETVDREVMGIVREVALDTAAGSMLEITKYLHKHPHGADYSTLNLFLRHRDDKLKDNLRFMLRIGAFDLTTETTTGPIQGRYLYKLTPHMNELYERIFPLG